MVNAYMVRAAGGELIGDFRENGCVAVGWGHRAGDLTGIPNEDIRDKLSNLEYQGYSAQAIAQGFSQIKLFLGVQPGDTIITYDPYMREYSVGEALSVPIYKRESGVILDETPFPHIIPVKWNDQTVPRDTLSKTAKYSLGNIRTVFPLPDFVVDEIKAVLNGVKPTAPISEEEAEGEDLKEDLKGRANELITDILVALSPDEFPLVIAGILRAMGYKTTLSRKGSDLGKDIIASADPLAVGGPRLKIEVKHRTGAIGAPDLRSFIGGLRSYYDAGLYVSTGGYSKEARYEADRATIPITLLDLEGVLELLLENYELLDTEIKALVPLVKVYWPAK